MGTGIKTIHLALPFRLGSVNCYLVSVDTGYVLIDTGPSHQRSQLVSILNSAGCQSGNLRLIILTHGDFDHAGNAAYLRDVYGTKIAMHRADVGMVERGDMFSNRTKGNPAISWISAKLFGFGNAEKFTPDIYLDDGSELDSYGFSAQVLSIPGHSKGSIGILTATGDLFCGDLLDNTNKHGTPTLNSIMDDLDSAHASVEKLRGIDIKMVYPGHGEAFSLEQFTNR